MIRSPGSRRIAAFAFFVGVVVALYFAAEPYLSLDTLIAREQSLRENVADHPLMAVGIVFLVYVALTLVPGLAGKSVVVGWLIGFLPGLLVVNCGLTLAAATMFLVSRYFFNDFVKSKLRWLVERVNRALPEENNRSFLVGMRLLHAPYTLTNYALGVTGVGLRRFWWTTQLGLLPGNVAFVLAGASLPSLATFAKQGVWSFVNVPLLIGLTLLGLLPLAVRWWGRRYLKGTGRPRSGLGRRPGPQVAGSGQRAGKI